ncbi:MlaD family protein [Thiothrix sp.]|jgi:paraquat-inducible protein B|uniref:PqiB family protein n=1 Tax=Thiothrix sp. TaxID=1032 RepID=UPI00257E6F7C|nr:MlaD family protein [Thiothrix sp.]
MSTSTDQLTPLAEVNVRAQRWPSPVWLIPLTALLVGLWLLFQIWYAKGPEIVVQFTSAEGIVSGKTEVRFKAVTVGKVKELKLSDDLKYIEAAIELNKEIGQHLGSDARFWVVKPNINRSGVSGLTTLFSGTYIGMDPGSNSDDLSFYQGEERPPVIAPSESGRRFFLLSDSLGSMDIGAPVFYKQLQVGEVIDYKLLPEQDQVRLEVFIRDPYYDFVRTTTRFWNASGAEFNMSAAGAEFRMESLTSLLIGGVAFETPKSIAAGEVSTADAEFVLYKNFAAIQEKQFSQKLYYVMYFNGSVRGLAVGAPVEFQGIPLGKVENIDMKMDMKSHEIRIPVLVSIQPQRFDEQISKDAAQAMMSKLVSKGLRARMETASLLTGQKLVTLSMEKDPQPAEIIATQFYSEFPTVGSALDDLPLLATEIMGSLQETLDGVKKLVNSGKLDKAVDNLNGVLSEAEQAVRTAKKVLETVDKQTLPSVTQEMNKTLQKLQGSLSHIDRLTAQNSPTQYQLQEMLEEVTAASRSVRTLAETLQRQPSSLIRGKQGE